MNANELQMYWIRTLSSFIQTFKMKSGALKALKADFQWCIHELLYIQKLQCSQNKDVYM